MFTFVNLWNLSNHTLFDDIDLPTGSFTKYNADGTFVTSTITPNKDILVNSIFDEVAEMQPLTIDVDVMKMKINNFFLKNKANFERLIAINLVKYSPIENIDRYETQNGTNEGTSDTSTTISENGTDTTVHKVSAFDSDTLQTASNDTLDSSNSRNLKGNDSIKNKNTNTIHSHGNIGVTTNQQMLTGEVEFWNKFSFYKIVANKFMFELCLTCETYE